MIPPAHVAYTVEVVSSPTPHYRVSVTAEGLRTPDLAFQLPAWTPGWYVLRGNATNLSGFSARSASQKPLQLQQADPQTWRVSTEGSPSVTFSYDVKASDSGFGFFEPYLDRQHGFVPGPATLAYVVEGKEAPCTIAYKLPTGWEAASGNTPVAGVPATFSAPNYDTLADQPAELGKFTRIDRVISGVPVSVVLVGGEPSRYTRWSEGVFKVAQAGIKLFGGAPFERYVFFFHFAREGGFMGGLEHLNSTVIRLDPSVLSRPDAENLTLVAHEYVHAWNIKRIRPAALGPFDYTRPVRVNDLWFAEGVTDYFAPTLVAEAGLGTQRFWLGYQAEQLTQLMSNPARHTVTLEDTSYKVWESKDESEGYGGLSYYNKGLVVGLLLDIELRKRTENRIGLVDVLKDLLSQSKKSGRGYADREIERTASRLAGSDLSAFFERALRSTDELPITEQLNAGGILSEEAVSKSATLGIGWDLSTASQARIGSLAPQGPAAKAGLQVGDQVLSINGTPLDSVEGSLLTSQKPGEVIKVTYHRGGATLQAALTLGLEEARSYRLRALPRPSPLQEKILAVISGQRSTL